MYSYLIPALILGSAFLFDALRTSSGLQDDEITATTMSTWSFAAPPLTSIQLSQTVEVVEEHALQDKRTLYEKFDPETP